MSEIINQAIDEHNPVASFALFSGGHDSLVSTHYAMESGADAVVHVNTGIGIPETREFVRQVCDRFEWPLKIYHAHDNAKADGTPDPQIYEELVLKWGFPGPAHHYKMYNRLKERQIMRLCRDAREERGDRILLITGLRQEESQRRMAYDDPIDRRGGQVWVNPCFRWSDDDCEEYMEQHDLPRNPVKDRLCMSGECLCGAYARDGEMQEIEGFYPKVAEKLKRLEEKVEEAGFPWGWEDGPPEWWTEYQDGQEFLPGAEPDDRFQPMCAGCESAHEEHKRASDKTVEELMGELEITRD